MENKKSKNKHYIPTYELVFYRHENYKTFLTEKKKEAKISQQALTLKLKKNKERLKMLEAERVELLQGKKFYREDEKAVDTEYSYRKKIVALQKKYDFLDVLWDGDEDVYTTWVYSQDFDGDKDWEGDPYADEHYKDSYEEAYNTCLEYIEIHNKL